MKLFTFSELNQTYKCKNSKKYFTASYNFFSHFEIMNYAFYSIRAQT